jgi:hypothetical protein
MKYITTMILALACLTATAADIGTAPPFEPVTLNTNTSPLLSGPFVDILDKLTTATNWGVAAFGIYTPNSTTTGKKAYGAGAVFLYNINSYVATGLGIDWLENDVTMPSGQIQFQAPLKIANSLTLTPFVFTGIATPISGDCYNNGQVVGLFGAGLGAKVYDGFNVFYAIEQRTGQNSPWSLFGIAYSKWF